MWFFSSFFEHHFGFVWLFFCLCQKNDITAFSCSHAMRTQKQVPSQRARPKPRRGKLSRVGPVERPQKLLVLFHSVLLVQVSKCIDRNVLSCISVLWAQWIDVSIIQRGDFFRAIFRAINLINYSNFMAINYHFTESRPVCVWNIFLQKRWQSGYELIRHLNLYYRVLDTPACIPRCISSTPPLH